MRKRGFTIIELIIVVSIIAVLTLLVTFYAFQSREQARLSKVGVELADLAKDANQYYLDNNYQYPADVGRGVVPTGFAAYLPGGSFPTSPWPTGVFDWDNWLNGSEQVYQFSYHLCGTTDPVSACKDASLFSQFDQYSTIFYCISGPCIPAQNHPTDPGYCVNCTPKKQNY